MDCEMCGMSPSVKKIFLEGSVLSVCAKCASYGKEVFIAGKVTNDRNYYGTVKEPDEFETVEGFGALIQRARQGQNLTQEELAQKISVKKHIVTELERGVTPPTVKDLRKLEKYFGIKLVA